MFQTYKLNKPTLSWQEKMVAQNNRSVIENNFCRWKRVCFKYLRCNRCNRSLL